MSQASGTVNFGIQRHNASQEHVYFYLNNGGSPFSAVAPALGTGATKVAVTLEMPDDSAFDMTASSPPATTIEEIGTTTGLYRLRLWGSGQSTPHNKPLLQTGRYGVRIYSTTGAFDPVLGFYEVADDFDISFAAIYVPGSGGSDVLRGTLSFHHWSTHERIATPQTALTSLSVVIRDEQGSAILNLTTIATDFTQSNDALFFSTSVAGLSGAHVLVARITAVYQGFTAVKDVLLPSRFAA